MKEHFVSAVIVSAGNSTRMGGVNKQFLEIGGMPVIARTVSSFNKSPFIDEIIIVTRDRDIAEVENFVKPFEKVKAVVTGGSTRQRSVFNGIEACSDNSDFLAIHDGARPLVSAAVIENTILSAFETNASAAGVRVKDTVKIVDDNGDIISTPDRDTLRLVQTPQVFSKELYLSAMESVEGSESFTDDCKLIEAYGKKVKIVDGDYKNIKITTPEDVLSAEIFFKETE